MSTHFLDGKRLRSAGLLKATILIVVVVLGYSYAGCKPQDRSAEGVKEPASARAAKPAQPEVPRRQWKILHIMSYHAAWEWNDDQFRGFQEALKDLDVEYRVFEMDTKRRSSEEWKLEAARQARELIDSWKPDLVYTNDDNVQEYVVRHYVNTDIPFVFSGVNAEPEEYGFAGSTNVTGVLEREHSSATIRLLRSIVPSVTKIAVFLDKGPTWAGVKARMQEKCDELEDVELVDWYVIRTFDEYKEKVRACQTTVDALVILGVHTLKDGEGNNVPHADVLRWTAENSTLPDCSFWKDRIPLGTLCAVTVSAHEQGLAAGKIAKRILVENESPSEIPMRPTVKGQLMISLARANRLGVTPKTSVLLAGHVIKEFAWEP